MRYLLVYLFTILLLLPFVHAQDYTRWDLPDGALARLGKGSIIGDIVFSPDSKMLAIPSSIGIWLYDAQTYKELALLKGNTSRNKKIEFSPNGTILVSVDGRVNNTIRLWNLSNTTDIVKQKVIEIKQKIDISSIAFSPIGGTLATVCYDNTVVLCNSHTGHHKITLKGHTNRISSIAFATNNVMLASGSIDGTVRLWNLKTGIQMHLLNTNGNPVNAITFSGDNSILAYNTYEGPLHQNRIRFWNVTTKTKTPIVIDNVHNITSLVFSPNRKTIVGIGEFETRIWDIKTGKQIQKYLGSFTISPDWTQFASTQRDKILLWNSITGKHVKTFTGYNKDARNVVFSPDSKKIANGNSIWDIETDKYTAINEEHVSIGRYIRFTHDSKTLASHSYRTSMWFWNVKTGKQIAKFEGDIFALSSDGKMVASGFRNRNVTHPIQVWDTKTGKPKFSIHAKHQRETNILTFSPDNKTLVSSCAPNEKLKIWDANSAKLQQTISIKPYNSSYLTFSPDSQLLVTRSSINIEMWDFKNAEHITTLKGHTDDVNFIRFSSNGLILASASTDETVYLWNTKTGKHIVTLFGHTDRITSMAFSCDGKTLATASNDATIRLWNTKNGKHKTTLVGHTRNINTVTFSPDGKTFVSTSDDGTIRFWDTKTWHHKLTLNVEPDIVFHVAFSPDGKMLAIGGDTILLWKLTDVIRMQSR